ncbi:MAG TPA: MFS transporter [Gemmataceae bacterium]
MSDPAADPRPERPTRVRYVVLAGLCLVACLAYVQRGALGIAESTVRTDLGISEELSGQAIGVFFLAYALFQIPTGMLVDAWGARWALLLFGMAGAATVALGAAGGVALLLLGRLLMGVAQAGLFPAATRCIATWFPLSRRAFATGTLTAFMSVGGALGALLTGTLLGVTDWRTIFVLYAVPGVLWSIWFFAWFRDRPEEHPSANGAERDLIAAGRLVPAGGDSDPRPRTPWLRLFTRLALLALCGQQFFRAMATVLYLSWFATFLQETYRLSPGEAGRYTTFPLIGVTTGSFAGGMLSDWVLLRTGSRRWARRGVAVAGPLVGVCLFAAAYFIPTPAAGVAVITAAAFFAAFANPCAYSLTIDMGGRHIGSVFSTMNMAGNLGAAAFPLIVPAWVRLAGGDWGTVLFLVGGLYLAGIFGWLLLDPQRQILEEDEPGRET